MNILKKSATSLFMIVILSISSNALADPPTVTVDQGFDASNPGLNAANLQASFHTTNQIPLNGWVLAKFTNANGTNTYQVFRRTSNTGSYQFTAMSDAATPNSSSGGGGGGGYGINVSWSGGSASIGFYSSVCLEVYCNLGMPT